LSLMDNALILTLGFDEKFAIRALMRHGRDLRKVLVVMAEPVDERAQRALNAVKDFVERFMTSVQLEAFIVNPSEPYDAMRKLKDVIRRNPALNYVISVSGGMRALIVELLIVASIMKLRGEVEIELENFRGTVSLPATLLYMEPLGSEEHKVLKVLMERGPMTAKDLMDLLKIPRSSLYRRIKELKTRGLVVEVREGKAAVYEVNNLAYVAW